MLPISALPIIVCHGVLLCSIVCHCVPWCAIVCHGVSLCSVIQLYNKIPKNYYPTDFCVPVKRHSMVFHSVPLFKRMD